MKKACLTAVCAVRHGVQIIRLTKRNILALCVIAVFAASAQALNGQDETAGIRIAAAVAPAVVEIKTTKAAGTGFLVESVGVLLTNEHVASSGNLISVKLSNGDIYNRINIVATDSARDIAVLRIPGFSLPTLRLGDSDAVQVGQRVFIVGNPLGLENTLTDGVVSAVRQFDGVRLFQVSAPISPGSSGSPVLNLNGEVVGIAVGKWRGGENLNFAVPINYARGLISLAPGTPATSRTMRTTR